VNNPLMLLDSWQHWRVFTKENTVKLTVAVSMLLAAAAAHAEAPSCIHVKPHHKHPVPVQTCVVAPKLPIVEQSLDPIDVLVHYKYLIIEPASECSASAPASAPSPPSTWSNVFPNMWNTVGGWFSYGVYGGSGGSGGSGGQIGGHDGHGGGGGNTGGDPPRSPPEYGYARAPEIDPSSAVSALTLLAGSIVVLRRK
jgi:uncharacterized membrane protein YgcG